MQRIKCKKSYIYKFNDCEALFDTISQLYKDYNRESVLYAYNKQFYLEVKHCIKHLDNKYNANEKHVKNILEEYAKVISKNAVAEIGRAIIGF